MANPVSPFKACLCLLSREGELVPYDTAQVDAVSKDEAIQMAKNWARGVEVRDGSHLQIMLNGHAAASLRPGEF